MADIVMRPWDGEDGVDIPGEFFIHRLQEGGHLIHYVCPRGQHCGVPLKPAKPNAAGCTWDWDGNLDKPTLSPSINCNAVNERTGKPYCGWHGHITAGVMKEA